MTEQKAQQQPVVEVVQWKPSLPGQQTVWCDDSCDQYREVEVDGRDHIAPCLWAAVNTPGPNCPGPGRYRLERITDE